VRGREASAGLSKSFAGLRSEQVGKECADDVCAWVCGDVFVCRVTCCLLVVVVCALLIGRWLLEGQAAGVRVQHVQLWVCADVWALGCFV